MRKSVFLSMLLFGLFFFVACDSGTTTGEATETTEAETPEASTEETPEAKTESSTTSGEGYTITVVDSEPKSPRKEMKANLGGADITVNYGSPSVKGRTIFGDLVPWDKVWRAGADAATTFECSQAVKVEGQDLAAGKYALFIEPHEEGTWTVIFNSENDQWGAYEYNKEKDVLRVDVTPVMGQEAAEQLDFVVSDDAIHMVWADAAAPFNIAGNE